MVTIIKGPTKTGRKEFTCLRCGAIFQADEWDYEFWNPDGVWGYRIPCPICKDNLWRYKKSSGYYEGVRDVEDEK